MGALLALALATHEFPPRIDRPLHAAIGQALAQEALRLLGPGEEITVITRDTEAFPQPALSVLLDHFRQAVHRAGKATPTVQFVQSDPLRPAQVPAGDFFELVRRSRSGSVIVSLLGPPTLRADLRINPAAIRAKIVAFCPLQDDTPASLRALFLPGTIEAAVVRRQIAGAGTSKPPQGTRAFEQLYRVVRVGESPSSTTRSTP